MRVLRRKAFFHAEKTNCDQEKKKRKEEKEGNTKISMPVAISPFLLSAWKRRAIWCGEAFFLISLETFSGVLW